MAKFPKTRPNPGTAFSALRFSGFWDTLPPMQNPIFDFMFRAFRIIVLVYLGLLGLLAGCQRRFIYHPSRLSGEQALKTARQSGLEPWHDADGEFAGWRRAASGDDAVAGRRRRVVVFHGNAGHALNRTYYIDGFDAVAPANWEVFLFEYPGFGSRDGRPSEKTIMAAASSAFAALMREDDAPIYLVGESLGSGPACGLAGEYPNQVAGVWLVTPFNSLKDAARIHYPAFPVGLLLRDRYDNVAALQSFEGPLVILTAGQDRVVPSRLGRRLYEQAATAQKRWIEQAQADHNSLNLNAEASIWSDVVAFWNAEAEDGQGAGNPGDGAEAPEDP